MPGGAGVLRRLELRPDRQTTLCHSAAAADERREEMVNVHITAEDLTKAFCVSMHALGNRVDPGITDILFVKPEAFDPGETPEIAREIGEMNAALTQERRKYVLIGPGRWGSADRWLGIPVGWTDICGVSAMIETVHPKLHAEPSKVPTSSIISFPWGSIISA